MNDRDIEVGSFFDEAQIRSAARVVGLGLGPSIVTNLFDNGAGKSTLVKLLCGWRLRGTRASAHGPGHPARPDVPWGGPVARAWQKLALARSHMRCQPLLYILDEPAASLDAASEYELFSQLTSTARQAADQRAITLPVSHRLSTVRDADLIVVLDRGRVLETGTHTRLMKAPASMPSCSPCSPAHTASWSSAIGCGAGTRSHRR